MAYCLKAVEEMDRFDADYEEAKNEIKENLSFLENEFDMMAILAWISRLEEPAACPEEKAVRNEYCKYLAHQLSRQTLHYPFTEDPPQGKLQPLSVSMDNPICADNKCRYEKTASVTDLKLSSTCDTTKMASNLGTTFSFHDQYAEDSWCRAGYTAWPLPVSSPIKSNQQNHSPCLAKGEPRIVSTPGAPCEPCAKAEVVVNTPRMERKVCRPNQCPKETKPCPMDPPPCPVPQGYLAKVTEEDDRPFSPPLPCTQENQARLVKIVDSVDEETELYEFLSEVAPFTCDLGETMQFVTSEELAHFKEFVKSVYQSRMSDTQELLTKEHIKLKARYDEWESNVIRQAQAALRALKLMLPLFKYDTYQRDPEYLYYMLRNQMSLEDTDVSPQARILRAKAQKKTWLNEEAQRIEKDNMDRMIQMRELNAQLAALSKSYNASHKRLTETNKCLEDQAAQLRIRHDENQKLIDYLIDQLNTPPRNY